MTTLGKPDNDNEVAGALLICDLPFPSLEELSDEQRREFESAYFRSYGALMNLSILYIPFVRDALSVVIPRERFGEAEGIISEVKGAYEKLGLPLRPKFVLIKLSRGELDSLARFVTGESPS
jgi:hypothetical protein